MLTRTVIPPSPHSAFRPAPPAQAPFVCPLCGSRDSRLYAHVDNANFSSALTSFDVLRCRTCGLAIIHPPPTAADVEEIYVGRATFSTPFPNPNGGKLFFRRLEALYARHGLYYHSLARRCLALLHRRAHPPRILDVGCSTGRLLGAFAELSPDAILTGIDIDPRAKANAPPALQDRIIIADFLLFKNLDKIAPKFKKKFLWEY